MHAAKTINKKLGKRPARENAMGSVKTPPPQTVAIKLKIAIAGDERRDSQSWAGTSSSREGRRFRSSRSLGQKEDIRLIDLNEAKARVAISGVDGIMRAWGDFLMGGIRCSRLGIAAMAKFFLLLLPLFLLLFIIVDAGLVLCGIQ